MRDQIVYLRTVNSKFREYQEDFRNIRVFPLTSGVFSHTRDQQLSDQYLRSIQFTILFRKWGIKLKKKKKKYSSRPTYLRESTTIDNVEWSWRVLWIDIFRRNSNAYNDITY